VFADFVIVVIHKDNMKITGTVIENAKLSSPVYFIPLKSVVCKLVLRVPSEALMVSSRGSGRLFAVASERWPIHGYPMGHESDMTETGKRDSCSVHYGRTF